MSCKACIYVFIFLLLLVNITESQTLTEDTGKKLITGGYIKGSFYYDLNRKKQTPLFSTGFSEASLKIETANGNNFRAFSDLRFRYGSEFNNDINLIQLKEAYVSYSFAFFTVSAGQQIIKWGRTDFTNTFSKLNPQNYISRSPDREDMDLGNILLSAKITPLPFLDIQTVFVPYYRPSVLLIDPVPVPAGVEIKQMKAIVTNENMHSYGVRSVFYLKGTDIGFIWFEGYDPMPGIKLDSFNLDMAGQPPAFSTTLSVRPYKTRVVGFDFETVTGRFGLRGEVSYSFPYQDSRIYEYVPMPEARFVFGSDFNYGNWRIFAEYAGKYIPRFFPSIAEPIIGIEPDYQKLAMLIMQPGFDIQEYVREQTGSLNRLFNYQTHRISHSASIRIENEAAYGRIISSVFLSYNLTTGDMLFMPEVKLKPFDGTTLTFGTEIYSGRKGSLYRLINDFMESIYVALRIDF